MFSGLSQLPESCLRLFELGGQQDFFLTLPWFENFVLTALAPEERVRIYAMPASSQESSYAAMLLMRSSVRPESPFSLRKLEALANYYSCFYAPHLNATFEPQKALDATCRAMAQEKPRWDAIEIKPLDNRSKGFPVLAAALKNAGYVVQTFFASGAWNANSTS